MTDTSLKDFAQWASEVMQSEWRRRTTFGKLLYPLWILNGYVACLIFLVVYALVSICEQINKIPQLLPDVHKSEEK